MSPEIVWTALTYPDKLTCFNNAAGSVHMYIACMLLSCGRLGTLPTLSTLPYPGHPTLGTLSSLTYQHSIVTNRCETFGDQWMGKIIDFGVSTLVSSISVLVKNDHFGASPYFQSTPPHFYEEAVKDRKQLSVVYLFPLSKPVTLYSPKLFVDLLALWFLYSDNLTM